MESRPDPDSTTPRYDRGTSRMTAQPACQPVDYGGPVDRAFESFSYAALEGSVIERFDAVVRRFPARLAIEDGALPRRAPGRVLRQLRRGVRGVAVRTRARRAGRAGALGRGQS